MNVFVTGGTGYVGSRIVKHLLTAGYVPVLLVRPGSVGKIAPSLRSSVEIVPGEIGKPETYARQLSTCGAVIHLQGIIREFPRKEITFQAVHTEAARFISAAAETAGVHRFLHMSALGARPDAVTGYHRSKFHAEEIVRESTLDWTIFRPSLVVGSESDGQENFITTLQDLLTMTPFVVPVIGSGKYRFQPVDVDNLATGFIRALTEPNAIRRVYDVAGPDVVTFNELLDLVAAGIKKKKLKVRQPMLVMKTLARFFGGYSFFPVSFDQIVMMEEESVTDGWRQFFDDFNIMPKSIQTLFGVNRDSRSQQ